MPHNANSPANTPRTRLATRLAFLVGGFVMACWAPLIPFAKARLGVGDGTLGLLLLCLGIGSLVAMPLTGWISARTGARPMIGLGGVALVVVLPLLAVVADPVLLGGLLLVLGAAMGTLDVAMNIHAVGVEAASDRPLMSGFHAMFSIGGFLGSGGMTLLLSRGLAPVPAALVAGGLALLALAVAWPRFLRVSGGVPTKFVRPKGSVLVLAGLAAIVFLVEGAMLDWGAVLMVGRGLVAEAQGGLGFMVFSATMTAGRLTGDRVVTAFGPVWVLVAGGGVTLLGLAVLLLAATAWGALTGFGLIGLGAANLVPVLFSLTGRQTVMPASMAIAAVTTTGYAGVLAGPALIGFVAHGAGLTVAFWCLAALMALVPLSARAIAR